MKRVFSSHIDQIGYDAGSQTLTVLFRNGKIASYKDVPPDVASSVVDAPSVGSALHQHIRGKYEHAYQDDEDNAESSKQKN